MARRYPLYLNTIEELLATDENIAIWQRSDLGAKFKDFFFDSFKLVLCNFGSISKTSVHSAKMMDELRKGLGDNLDIFDIYIFPELAEPPEGVLDPEKFAHMHSERTDSKKGGISVYIKTDCLLKTDMEKVVSGYASALDVKIQFQGVPFNISSFYIPPIHSFVLPITQKIIEDSVIVNKARSTIFAGDFNVSSWKFCQNLQIMNFAF